MAVKIIHALSVKGGAGSLHPRSTFQRVIDDKEDMNGTVGFATRLRQGYGVAGIEPSRWGIARVDGNAARVAGASTGSASDQGKATRVGASELGQRTSFKRFPALGAIVICGLVVAGCSRKPAQVAPTAPEVLVTTVTPKDVPRVLERVATLDGFINANINAQVQGYIISRDYQEGSVVKKGDLLFQIDPRPFEAALAQAKGTWQKTKPTR